MFSFKQARQLFCFKAALLIIENLSGKGVLYHLKKINNFWIKALKVNLSFGPDENHLLLAWLDSIFTENDGISTLYQHCPTINSL